MFLTVFVCLALMAGTSVASLYPFFATELTFTAFLTGVAEAINGVSTLVPLFTVATGADWLKVSNNTPTAAAAIEGQKMRRRVLLRLLCSC